MLKNKFMIWSDKNFFEKDHDYTHCYTHNNCSVELHAHTFTELNIVCSGTGIHHIYNKDIKVSKGNMFIVQPNTPHSYENTGNLIVRHILISHRFFEKYENELSSLPEYSRLFKIDSFLPASKSSLTLNDKDFEVFDAFWNIITLNNLDDKSPVVKTNEDFIVSTGLVLSLISFLCSIHHDVYETQTGPVRDLSIISEAIKYITDHYDEKLPTQLLAKLCNLSESTFLRYFKKIFNMSPSDYIASHRITHSKILLANTIKSITEIAQDTGFFDSAHFSKTFKRIVGLSPLQYRQKSKK